jgi:hypothetical protein
MRCSARLTGKRRSGAPQHKKRNQDRLRMEQAGRMLSYIAGGLIEF